MFPILQGRAGIVRQAIVFPALPSRSRRGQKTIVCATLWWAVALHAQVQLISRPVPPADAVERGQKLFVANCGFCHGQAAHGATGPSLITSDVVLADDHGEHLAPFLKKGSPDKGMPAFSTMTDQELTDVAEFLHQQVEESKSQNQNQNDTESAWRALSMTSRCAAE